MKKRGHSQGENMKLKPYPKRVCWDCANPIAKVKDVGAITVYSSICDVCKKEAHVSTPGDYGWPDFPGYVKVKRAYVWD